MYSFKVQAIDLNPALSEVFYFNNLENRPSGIIMNRLTTVFYHVL